jgi:glutamate-1-semialdehyde 2,1-aminomutase
LNLLPGGVNSPVRAFKSVEGDPIVINRGSGAYLYDVDENKYIDYVLSWGPLVLGHSHPDVVNSLHEVVTKGTSYGAPTEIENKLAKLIIDKIESIEMIRFVNSGTEACMSALRLARAYTKKTKIIKFAGNYHGHADMFLIEAGSGVATLNLPNSPGVPQNTISDSLIAEYNDIDSVIKLFGNNPDEIAGVIIEPIAANMGFVLPEENFQSSWRNYVILIIHFLYLTR